MEIEKSPIKKAIYDKRLNVFTCTMCGYKTHDLIKISDHVNLHCNRDLTAKELESLDDFFKGDE